MFVVLIQSYSQNTIITFFEFSNHSQLFDIRTKLTFKFFQQFECDITFIENIVNRINILGMSLYMSLFQVIYFQNRTFIQGFSKQDK